jgi:hypothetical protein
VQPVVQQAGGLGLTLPLGPASLLKEVRFKTKSSCSICISYIVWFVFASFFIFVQYSREILKFKGKIDPAGGLFAVRAR